MVKIVSLTGTLAYTGKHGISAMFCCNITDQFLNQNGLAHARAAKESDLPALLIRTKQIHYLDSGLQQFLFCSLLLKLRGRSVNRLIGYTLRSRLIVNWLP